MSSKLISHINIYKDALEKASKWHGSQKSIAPVELKDETKGERKEDSYVYEFYCYISIVHDLQSNYTIRFVEGEGAFKNKFPQAGALKEGKPRFEAYDNKGNKLFQICAGTKVRGKYASESEHPDISFQLPDASDDPGQEDLIFILDAKYQDDFKSRLKKGEAEMFAYKVNNSFQLQKSKVEIRFHRLQGFDNNCLITNARPHNENDEMLKGEGIKEIAKFYLNDETKPYLVKG